MPGYPWLFDNKVDLEDTVGKLKAMKALGVPYEDEQIVSALDDYRSEADQVVDIIRSLAGEDTRTAGDAAGQSDSDDPLHGLSPHDLAWDSELVALIAYLRRLGNNELVTRTATSGGK